MNETGTELDGSKWGIHNIFNNSADKEDRSLV